MWPFFHQFNVTHHFLVKFVVFYFYAYEFRNTSKPLNPRKNIKKNFLFESREIFVFFHGDIHKNKVFRFYWYGDQIVSFFVTISILNQCDLSYTFQKL